MLTIVRLVLRISRLSLNMYLDDFITFWGIFCSQGLKGYSRIINSNIFNSLYKIILIQSFFFNLAKKMHISINILHWSFGIFVFLLNAYFSTRVLSYIISVKTDIPFTSTNDLLKSTTYKITVVKNTLDEKAIVRI